MDHETAIRIQAAERYVLEEFTPEERVEFEDHYFGCAECADEVRSASILAANARVALQGEASRAFSPAARKRWLWWPLLASAALNAVLIVNLGVGRFVPAYSHAAVQPQFYHSFAIPAAS